MVIVSLGGVVGWGQSWWWGRLTAHLDILRLMTRGLERCRRCWRGSARISLIAWVWASARLWGGKSRVGACAAACGAEASDER
jgi:hypothetical protein